MKKFFCVILSVLIVAGFTACSDSKNDDVNDGNFYDEFPTGDEIVTVILKKNPVATIELSDGGKVVIELCYDAAPNTVASFIAYVNADCYDGFGFTQVRDSAIVMSDLIEDEYSSPFYIKEELNSSLSHLRGTVTMSRTEHQGQVTGRFSILTEDRRHFDKYNSAFGKVIEGMDYIDRIAATEVNTEDYHVENPIEIVSITVDTFDQEIPDPVIIRKD